MSAFESRLFIRTLVNLIEMCDFDVYARISRVVELLIWKRYLDGHLEKQKF